MEILYDLGLGDRLVGVSRFTVYPPEAKALPQIGGLRDPDLETVLSLRPDLVILRGRQAKLEQLCRERGIGVYHDPSDTLADIRRSVRELGGLLGCRPQAAALRRQLDEALAAVRRRVAPARPVKVLFTLRSPDRLVNIGTVARGSYLHELIELAGGVNIFGELAVAYPQVSTEEILARGPEVIIEAMPGAGIEAEKSALLDQWRRVGPIPAVETGRLHVLRGDYVLIPSPRAVRLLAERLGSVLHPEEVSDGR